MSHYHGEREKDLYDRKHEEQEKKDKEIKWHEIAPPTPKDKKMPMTEEYFYKVLAMNEELIDDMRDEISALKMTVNKLRQKLKE
jgi:HAMP domain-containing protein